MGVSVAPSPQSMDRAVIVSGPVSPDVETVRTKESFTLGLAAFGMPAIDEDRLPLVSDSIGPVEGVHDIVVIVRPQSIPW